jgi:hypothetical protein
MSQVLGKEVRFQQITFEAYKDRFVRPAGRRPGADRRVRSPHR